jgi:8-oxo-dGTP diphosphatase
MGGFMSDYRPTEIVPGEGRLPTRFTAGAFLVRAGKVLLEQRPGDAKVYPGLWDTPGGHVEEGETPEAALARELEEELGITPTRFVLAAVQDDLEGDFYRHFVYIVKAWEGEPASREGRIIEWYTHDEAMELERLNPLIRSAWRDFRNKGWL